jgi:hypothetical protein
MIRSSRSSLSFDIRMLSGTPEQVAENMKGYNAACRAAVAEDARRGIRCGACGSAPHAGACNEPPF